ncbi:hypothetical protein AN618_12530 [Fervidicola ferrireducens]|uniref:Uncharacterized protein n=1 Tax=Fervidicola ferrireducens TaxID=520764 RepID=A0A140L9J9_9FIRM|nr:hypothetical protein AN618_12530 [Fervidicola ferrireducens]
MPCSPSYFHPKITRLRLELPDALYNTRNRGRLCGVVSRDGSEDIHSRMAKSISTGPCALQSLPLKTCALDWPQSTPPNHDCRNLTIFPAPAISGLHSSSYTRTHQGLNRRRNKGIVPGNPANIKSYSADLILSR